MLERSLGVMGPDMPRSSEIFSVVWERGAVGKLTFEICALLFSKVGTRILDSGRKTNLDISRHSLFGRAHPSFANNGLHALDTSVTLVKATGNILGQPLDLGFFLPLGVIVIETR